MYLGVITKPNPEHDFDGKIFLQRVSRSMEYKKVTHNQWFTDDGTLDSDLRNGDWLNLLVDDMTLGDLLHSISDDYFMDNNIVSRLVFKYHIPGKDRKKSTVKYIVDKDKCLPSANPLKSRYPLMVR